MIESAFTRGVALPVDGGAGLDRLSWSPRCCLKPCHLLDANAAQRDMGQRGSIVKGAASKGAAYPLWGPSGNNLPSGWSSRTPTSRPPILATGV